MKPQRIVIAGGSGFIGRVLAKEYAYRHCDVVILTRTPRVRTSDIREVAWDGKNPGDWVHHLSGADALINLTGKNINCPHTRRNLRELTESRIDSIKALAAACERVTVPPRVWVQASATGFYGDSGDALCDEHAPAGHNALADICRRWEDAFTAAELPRTRKATLRIGFVLGRNGGAFPLLAKLATWGLGGRAGNGRQFISWIHLYDLLQMFHVAVERENFAVTANAVAPNPVTNGEFMRELRRAVKRPWSPPVPALAVKLGAKFMESEPALVLTGQRCVPGVFQELEFPWRYPQVYGALEDLCRKR
jgi:uncharacterized protein (TIGR01777 family)